MLKVGSVNHLRYVMASNPVTLLAFSLFGVMMFVAIFGPLLVPYDPLASTSTGALQPPSWQHWFGTDQVGRDVFSRVIVATRLDRRHRGKQRLGIGMAGVEEDGVIVRDLNHLAEIHHADPLVIEREDPGEDAAAEGQVVVRRFGGQGVGSCVEGGHGVARVSGAVTATSS